MGSATSAVACSASAAWTDGDEKGKGDDGDGVLRGSVKELREAVAVDPKLNVLIVHGWSELSCPFMASVLIADQMPVMGNQNRVRVKEYAGGHMFYSRSASQLALRADAQQMYAEH